MKRRILIIDDHAEFRVVLRNYLRQNFTDLEIFEAASGELGISMALEEKPEVILMDINLPQINGLEAVSRIRHVNPDCHIIILTFFNIAVFENAAKELKVDDFIFKGELFERLVVAINKCFDGKIKA